MNKMIMKKLYSFICAICVICGSVSCSDMLETESSRQIFDPELGEKTDSLAYAFGIFQAMQQLADQYVLQGEVRGDLVELTTSSDSYLRQLADFSATTANKYDSAYVYYRVINNCNYYIAHRNTELYTGATNVVINEYAAVKAIRAWAYMQLARNYGKVPFFTEPLTQISQIDNGNYPELDINGIVSELAPDLEKYTGFTVPSVYSGNLNIGNTNWSQNKTIRPSYCFIPVDVVLGDMYLEVGNYGRAASHFITYLTTVAPETSTGSYFAAPMRSKNSTSLFGGNSDSDLPNQRDVLDINMPAWSGIFAANTVSDIITYIPMAVSAQNGPITNLPLIFGADYYATPDEASGYRRTGSRLPLVTNIQLVPSATLNSLSDSTEYYYYVNYGTGNKYDSIRSCRGGDMRLRSIIDQQSIDDTDLTWIKKYDYANIVLYRNSTVLLRLAEAFNRLGMCDAAFAILKDGISEALVRPEGASDGAPYMTEDTKSLLRNEYPLLKDSFLTRFPMERACGIHCHGAGKAASDLARATYTQNKSPYTYSTVIGKKMKEIAGTESVSVGTTKQDTINAIEDLICDEYALELAFEGNRFADLCRLARHKNEAGLYGGNFGSLWLARKLAFKNPQKDLTNPENWYLPFK